ncbi:aromatic acid exporter family protein [Actinoplanes sp. DH11]|uniref:FUSC family protein n=1 Tax=Actinoplanes sp. DH11 TaxID=2857011 RepID=UPI001E64C341|nr:FUSC family protein [Actinoplanes sp. DH11]
MPLKINKRKVGVRQAIVAATAATVAWLLAAHLIGHPDPLFAPTAALVVLGEARGRQLRQTAEIVLGVAAGVLVAELVVLALGPGIASLFLVLLLTVGPMVAAGASSTLVTQAAVSAVYLVLVAAPEGRLIPFRFADALIGGAVAIAASQLTVARRPLAPLVTAARQTYADLADLLDDLDAALTRMDETAAHAVLDRAHELNVCVERLHAAALAAGETVRLRVRRRRRLRQIRNVEQTTHQLDHVVGNVWVLARNAVTLARLHAAAPAELNQAIRELSRAVRSAGEALATDLSGHDDAERHAGRAEAAALEAVRLAAQLLEDDPGLPVTMIVGQIRTTAVDLLRGVGPDDDAVLSRVDDALGLVDATDRRV